MSKEPYQNKGNGISLIDYVKSSKRGKSSRQSGKGPERNVPNNDQDPDSDIEKEGYRAASRRVLLFGADNPVSLKQVLHESSIWKCGQLYEPGQLPDHSIYIDFMECANAEAFVKQKAMQTRHGSR